MADKNDKQDAIPENAQDLTAFVQNMLEQMVYDYCIMIVEILTV